MAKTGKKKSLEKNATFRISYTFHVKCANECGAVVLTLYPRPPIRLDHAFDPMPTASLLLMMEHMNIGVRKSILKKICIIPQIWTSRPPGGGSIRNWTGDFWTDCSLQILQQSPASELFATHPLGCPSKLLVNALLTQTKFFFQKNPRFPSSLVFYAGM
jgi:hypothetical protein